MKVLKIKDNQGFYWSEGSYKEIDKIDKDGLLELVNLIIEDESAEIEEFNPELLQNKAHQVIYSSLYRKLDDLRSRRSEFVDESQRLFLEHYRRYKSLSSVDTEKESKEKTNKDVSDKPKAVPAFPVTDSVKPEDTNTPSDE